MNLPDYDQSELTASTTPTDESEHELVFSTKVSRSIEHELDVEFADGRRTLPGWLVANLGGRETLEQAGQQAKLKTITYAAFMAHWTQQNTKAVIGRALAKVRKQHLSDLRKHRFTA